MSASTADGDAAAIVAVGECMLELRAADHGWQLGCGGDTFKTAVYLARLDEDVAYLTALGDDPLSAGMRGYWQAEGLSLDLLLTAPHRLPGLCVIQTDSAGERSFHYWREQAAVPDLFRLPGCADALDRLAGARLLYVSGFTLALFDGRAALSELAPRVRDANGEVAFDLNYRPNPWARPTRRQAIAEFAPG